MADHAILAPSSAKRWLTCTPSARLEELFPNSESEAAAEGTLAHELSEFLLKQHFGLVDYQGEEHWFDHIKQEKYYTPEMLSYCEAYRDFCLDTVYPESVIFIERKYDMTSHIPEGFGTGDFLSITPSLKLLEFTDLKFGKGVPVSAVDNDQLKIYALGALNEFSWVYDIETIRVNIYQPRINNNSTWEISVKDLMIWADEYLKPRAEIAFKGEGEFVVGDHCRFCRVITCKARADYNLKLAKYAFANAIMLKDDEIMDIVAKADQLKTWATSIADYALSEAVKGKKWPGWKVVEGKSNRVFVSASVTEQDLLYSGYDGDLIYTPRELLGITELKKNIGSKAFKDIVEPGLRKPAGKPTLVLNEDARNEFDSAASIFKNAAIREEIE